MTISRSGPRWFAAFNVRLPAPPVAVATRAQRRRGAAGMGLGVEVIQRPSSRSACGGPRSVPKSHVQVAAQRADAQHHPTKALAIQFAQVVIENLKVKNMSKSAKGTLEEPGSNVRQKAGLNRASLDVGFGEVRRQLAYETGWYGSGLSAVRSGHTSQTCHRCGHVDSKFRRTRSVCVCTAWAPGAVTTPR
ncbi:zinc ribbon domain-containing protein [Streptomyces zagrosensis]|uniref:Cas12f1-like TNB domain-containing protein n=1 Tax=Streptomyces zagrosensis TaxID=1042984 RepID=A0A7W9V1C4_9ACTN|nr:zinc ribbon domain-containing protein [Streptomyces zagrosensis]MBB5939045.1 hypothetical protein [Streptomyces zagrosensis]